MKLTKTQSLLDKNGKVIGGKWEINRKHEIQYRPKDKKSETRFKATILDVKPAALILSHTTKEDDGKVVTRINKLKGVWRADSKNRLTFQVQRQRGNRDVLTLKKAWKLNKNQEIEYTYQKEALKTKTKRLKKLTFKGFWDITDKNRITYSLGKDSKSHFKFKGAFQTKSIRAKKGEIRYQVGIQVEKKIRTKTVVLFGKWKYSNKLGLNFEIEYKNGKKHAISFGGEYRLSKRDQLEFNLKNRRGKRLGIELVLTRDFLKKDGQAFIKLLRSQDESKIEGGLKFRW